MIVKLETTLYRYLEDQKFLAVCGLKYKMIDFNGIVPISHILKMKKDWFKYHKALQLLSEAANVPGEIIIVPSPLFRFVRNTPPGRWSEMNVFTHWDIEATSKNKVISICSTKFYSDVLTEDGRVEIDNISTISTPEGLTTLIRANFDQYEGNS
jgi:hypothetical protein